MTSTIAHSPINHFQLLCFSFFFFFSTTYISKNPCSSHNESNFTTRWGGKCKKVQKSHSVSLKFILVCDPSKILGFVANQLYPFQFVHEQWQLEIIFLCLSFRDQRSITESSSQNITANICFLQNCVQSVYHSYVMSVFLLLFV